MAFRSLIAVAATILAASTAPARGQIALSLAGGIDAPVSTLGDIADLGYSVAAGLNLGAPTVPVGLRFEGAYNGLQLFNASADLRIISATANAVFNVGRARNAPYLIGGLGGYNRHLSITPISGSSDKTVLGINGGGGLRFPLSGITTFFEARYHVMLGDKSDAANYQFIPITFGIVF